MSVQQPVLCTTDHGVMLKGANGYAWVFINDIAVWGVGNEKLRWPSLRSAKLYKDIVLINTSSNTSETNVLYIVDLHSGQIVRLNNENAGIDSVDDYELVNGQLQVRSAKHKASIAVGDLF